MASWNGTGDSKLRAIIAGASRLGTLCGVLAMLTFVAGCPRCGEPADCPDDGNVCTDPTCEANLCGTANNTATCDDGDVCTSGDVCADGECAGTAIAGCCESDADCATGQVCITATNQCADTCTDAAECDDGNFCTINTCTNGVCLSTARNCSDGQFCNGAETCNEANDSCDSPGDPCAPNVCNETTDTCETTPACAVDGDCPSDNNECTDEVCVNGACESQNNTDGCDDGDACTNGDVCADGACSGNPVGCPAGKACNPSNGNCEDVPCDTNADCDDGFECTVDFCDQDSGNCVFEAINGLCSDGLFCNGVDACDPDDEDADAKGCVHSGNPCTNGIAAGLTNTPICVESTDTCRACANNNECSDGFSCTDDVCEGSGACTNPRVDARCDDDLFCTEFDFCEPEDENADSDGCVNEGDPCRCNSKSPPDECNFSIVASHNVTRLICTEADGGSCLLCEANADCNDGITCTRDTCNGEIGLCRNEPTNEDCPDPSFCDGEDFCEPDSDDADANGCVQPGDPCGGNEPICSETDNECRGCVSNAECSDGVDCTNDFCDGVTGACVNTPDNDNCAAGEFCDSEDDCQPILP